MNLRWNQIAALALLIVALWPLWQPGPGPDPTPGPLDSVAIVEETAVRSQLPAPQRALIGNVSFREKVTAKGLQFRRIDKDDVMPADWKWALDAAQGNSLPVLALRAKDKAKAIPLPADEAAALAVVEGGGK